MKILGIHFQSHDTSVSLIDDGKVVFAASNERFSRKKMDTNTPLQALDALRSYCKVSLRSIDRVVLVGDPFPYSYFNRLKELSWKPIKTRGAYYFWWKKPLWILREIVISTALPSFLYRELFSRILLKIKLFSYRRQISYVHHHLAHAYSAYYTSGWKTCLVCVSEGSGFDETMSLYSVQNGKWKNLSVDKLPHSAGRFYELVTEILGFNILRHPGKITGLSAYGYPRKVYPIVKKLLWTEGLHIRFDYMTFLRWTIYYALNKSLPKELIAYKREDIAAAFQRRLEECVVEIITRALEQTGHTRLALAGGIFANVKLNQRIHELPGTHAIHVHQAMGDDGLALGAALRLAHEEGEKLSLLPTVYLGPDYTNRQILNALRQYRVKFQRPRNVEREIARRIAERNVVARFNGRMEYGPRALGNRSILYEARDKSVNDWLNKRLRRTEFMPFAPVTLHRYASRCYKNIKGAQYPARFMTITFQCTEYMKRVSPAVVHVDGTARPQLIRRRDNPSYYKIVEEYYKITGIPTLVNTSFNMHEEPIVCTPSDALRSFLEGQLDYLAIGPYLVSK